MARSNVPEVQQEQRERIIGLISVLNFLLDLIGAAPPNFQQHLIQQALMYSNLLKQEYFVIAGQQIGW
jgi:hypothetical protein